MTALLIAAFLLGASVSMAALSVGQLIAEAIERRTR